MKHTLSASYSNVMLRPVCKSDLESLRLWRNDVENCEFLSKIVCITPEKQQEWYESDNANQYCYTFAVDETQVLKKLVGSVALYNLSETSAEFGRFLIGDMEARGKGIGYLGSLLCLYLGFATMGLETINAKVHEDNIAAVKAYLKAGFAISGKHSLMSGGYELEIVAERERFFRLHSILSKIQINNQ